MRQIAFPAALGSCALGTTAAPVRAAEWSFAPIYSTSVDYDSNRLLRADAEGSAAGVVSIDMRFKRALEDLDFTIEPHCALRRFSDDTLGNGDDRSVSSVFNWTRERSLLNLTASWFDQSTLITEPLETGIVSADTHRRSAQAGASWNWNQTERRAVVAQLSYMDVSYYGLDAKAFPGFRYTSGSLGERFSFTERGSVTLSAYGSVLGTSTPGNSSHEIGLQAQTVYSFSEQTNLTASLGESRRVLGGQSGNGTDASLTLTHSLFLGNLSFAYSRSLVPYGIGFLVQQQQFNATLQRPLTQYVDCFVTVTRIQNNETAVLLRIDRPQYNLVTVGSNWRPNETWTFSAQLGGVRTQLVGPGGQTINAWHSSLTVTWTPLPKSRSR